MAKSLIPQRLSWRSFAALLVHAAVFAAVYWFAYWDAFGFRVRVARRIDDVLADVVGDPDP